MGLNSTADNSTGDTKNAQMYREQLWAFNLVCEENEEMQYSYESIRYRSIWRSLNVYVKWCLPARRFYNSILSHWINVVKVDCMDYTNVIDVEVILVSRLLGYELHHLSNSSHKVVKKQLLASLFWNWLK